MDGMPATGLMGDGIPFEFVSLGAEAAEMMGGIYVMVYGLDGAVATFTIYGRATIAHTIDPRCLTETILFDVSAETDIFSATVDKSFAEIYVAINSGKLVRCIITPTAGDASGRFVGQVVSYSPPPPSSYIQCDEH